MGLCRKLFDKGNEDIIEGTVCGSNIKRNEAVVKSE